MYTNSDFYNNVIYVCLYFLVVITGLVLIIIYNRLRTMSIVKRRQNFVAKWQNLLNEYLEDKLTVVSFYSTISGSAIDMFLMFLKVYIQNLRGSDFRKVAALINETPISEKLEKELNSDSKNNIKRSAYFLGMAKNSEAAELVLKNLKYDDALVFENCAVYLARINYQKAVPEILRAADNFSTLNRAIIISIFLEYESTVCDLLINRFSNESLNNKINFVIIFRMFKYQEAASQVLKYFKEIDNVEFIIEAIKYFGEVEYIDSIDTLGIHLHNSSPEVIVEAIKVLTKVGAINLEGKLSELINNNDWNVQLAAANCMYDYSNQTKAKLISLAKNDNSSLETTIARMVISERSIKEV